MESSERTEKCKEVFSLLSEYLNRRPFRPRPARRWRLTSRVANPASSLQKAFARLWNCVAIIGRASCPSPLGKDDGNSSWKPTKR